MKLYITLTSPFARMARVVRHEKGLEDRVETELAKTRTADSPYYEINPSGRVPYLVRGDGIGLEESEVVCTFLDAYDGTPTLGAPAGAEPWEYERLKALARSLSDGVSVWCRELLRPREEDRSATVIVHEKARAQRLADVWEAEIDNPVMTGPLNMAQITLACALGLDVWNLDFQWREGRPKLAQWHDAIAARPSFQATVPSGSIQP